jgi:tRNA(Phe) wybutosine-synthesizing methylase Tyw3
MFWQGETIKVDAGLGPLLTAFNKIPGIATVASCVGDPENLGYVAFAGDNIRTVKLWLRKLRESEDRGALQEVSYTAHTRYGCVRFKCTELDAVCGLVSGLIS